MPVFVVEIKAFGRHSVRKVIADNAEEALKMAKAEVGYSESVKAATA